MAEMLRRPRSSSAPEPFPPVELLPYIKKKNRSHKVLEHFETKLTDDKVPDVVANLQALGETLTYSSAYEEYLYSVLREDQGPRLANVDHLASPAPLYRKHGHNSYQNRYREGAGLKVEMAIPLHNVATLLRLDASMPDDGIMKERAKEQDHAKHLYRIAKTALWLEQMYGHGMQTYQTAERYVLNHGYSRQYPRPLKFLPSFALLLDRLDQYGPSHHGILPDAESVSKMSLEEAVAELATWGANDVIMSAEESTAIIMEASRKATGYDAAA